MPQKFDIAKNLRVMAKVDELLLERHMKVPEFAARMGVLPSYVYNWRRRGIPADRWVRAAEVLGTSVDILTGRVVQFHEGQNENELKNVIPVILNGNIPIIGCAKLGDDGFFADVFADPDYTNGTLQINSRDPLAYAIRCVGNSMAPRIQSGEFVIAEPSVEAIPGDEVVVEDFEGRRMVKRFLYQRDGCIHLASVNEDFQPIVIDDKDVKSIHPVLAIVPKKFWHPA